jgi:hypothetical protein
MFILNWIDLLMVGTIPPSSNAEPQQDNKHFIIQLVMLIFSISDLHWPMYGAFFNCPVVTPKHLTLAEEIYGRCPGCNQGKMTKSAHPASRKPVPM